MKSRQWLIVSEGAKTEPYYFQGLLDWFSTAVARARFLDVRIIGTGKNTESLMRNVTGFFETVEDEYGAMPIPYGNIGVVFDRDSFGKGQFNNAIEMAKKQRDQSPDIEQYISAWSNESFELWIYLHFHYTDSAIGRHLLNEKLTQIFREHGVISGRQTYENHIKTRKTIFADILRCGGSVVTAVRNAEKLDSAYDKQDRKYADQNPRTKVHLLVRALAEEVGVSLDG